VISLAASTAAGKELADPEANVPIDDVMGRGAAVGQIYERPVNSENNIWSSFVFINQSHGPDAQRVGKEKGDEQPKDPKRAALVRPGIRGLRFGRIDFGSLLAHVGSLAGRFTFEKEIGR
jgi:hypothetical protein